MNSANRICVQCEFYLPKSFGSGWCLKQGDFYVISESDPVCEHFLREIGKKKLKSVRR